MGLSGASNESELDSCTEEGCRQVRRLLNAAAGEEVSMGMGGQGIQPTDEQNRLGALDLG